MAVILADRVKETTTTTGTGTLTLAGAATGYRSFAAIGNGNSTYYAIIDSTNNVWEVGMGVYTAAGTTLSRVTIFSNSSGTTTALTLAAGTKDVICTQPAWTTLNDDSLALGYQALNSANVGSGTNNVALGYQALKFTVNAANNTAVGSLAMATANVSNNAQVAVGRYALNALSVGISNCALGGAAMLATTSGNYNTGLGTFALFTLTNQADCTAVGYSALYYNNAAGNTAVGSNAGLNVNGVGNTALGYQALKSAASSTGTYNVALGYNALPAISSSIGSVGIGYNAGLAVSSAWQGVYIGYGAANSVTTGDGNIFIGYQAGGSATLTSGSNNCYIGWRAGYSIGNGSYNMCLGYLSGASMSTGQYNVIIGGYQGSGGVIDVTSTNQNVVISDNNGTILLYKVTSGLGGFNVPMAQKAATSGASTGTVNFDASTNQIVNATTAASANFTLNIRGTSTVALNTALPVGQPLTIEYWCLNGATAYYMSAFTIDGVSVTPKWITGTAPSAGNANAIDRYTFTIYKTAGSTYTVLAQMDKFA